MYLLEIAENYPNSYWLEYDNEKNPDHLMFKECMELDISSIPKITMHANNKASMDSILSYDYLFSSGPDVASDRLVKLLAEHMPNGEIQAFPVTISNGGREISGFNVINYVKCEPAIDIERSTFKPLIGSMPDGPKKFLHIVLLSKEPSYGIFRAEENKNEVVLSDELRRLLEAEGVKGVRFVREKRRG